MNYLKKILSLTLGVILMTVQLNALAEEGTITVTKDKITAVNVPSNGTLITALYDNETLLEAKMYSGSDTITVNFRNDMLSSIDNADTIKVFLWDMENLLPLCGKFESLISNLKDETEVSNKIKIMAGGNEFTATLENNETVNALKEMLPMTINMSELNGNEKYYYLSRSLPTDTQRIGTIQAGDIMLYGSSCIVIFYETFNTSYSYTRIGHIDDITELKSALGRGSVTVTIE